MAASLSTFAKAYREPERATIKKRVDAAAYRKHREKLFEMEVHEELLRAKLRIAELETALEPANNPVEEQPTEKAAPAQLPVIVNVAAPPSRKFFQVVRDEVGNLVGAEAREVE